MSTPCNQCVFFSHDLNYTSALAELTLCLTHRVRGDLIINKPSFCSGSCDEIHARSKLQNKTSLNTL